MHACWNKDPCDPRRGGLIPRCYSGSWSSTVGNNSQISRIELYIRCHRMEGCCVSSLAEPSSSNPVSATTTQAHTRHPNILSHFCHSGSMNTLTTSIHGAARLLKGSLLPEEAPSLPRLPFLYALDSASRQGRSSDRISLCAEE